MPFQYYLCSLLIYLQGGVLYLNCVTYWIVDEYLVTEEQMLLV